MLEPPRPGSTLNALAYAERVHSLCRLYAGSVRWRETERVFYSEPSMQALCGRVHPPEKGEQPFCSMQALCGLCAVCMQTLCALLSLGSPIEQAFYISNPFSRRADANTQLWAGWGASRGHRCGQPTRRERGEPTPSLLRKRAYPPPCLHVSRGVPNAHEARPFSVAAWRLAWRASLSRSSGSLRVALRARGPARDSRARGPPTSLDPLTASGSPC